MGRPDDASVNPVQAGSTAAAAGAAVARGVPCRVSRAGGGPVMLSHGFRAGRGLGRLLMPWPVGIESRVPQRGELAGGPGPEAPDKAACCLQRRDDVPSPPGGQPGSGSGLAGAALPDPPVPAGGRSSISPCPRNRRAAGARRGWPVACTWPSTVACVPGLPGQVSMRRRGSPAHGGSGSPATVARAAGPGSSIQCPPVRPAPPPMCHGPSSGTGSPPVRRCGDCSSRGISGQGRAREPGGHAAGPPCEQALS